MKNLEPSTTLMLNTSIDDVITYYSDMVYKLAYARTGSKHDADDIFQEVFLRYVRKNPTFENESHRKAWLLKVTCNCSNSFFSSFWNKRVVPLSDEVEEVELDLEGFSLEDELGKLPAKYREVIHLFYYEELSTKEVASILHRKESTVRMQLTRARILLKEIVEGEGNYVEGSL